jgi:hypothetical protein
VALGDADLKRQRTMTFAGHPQCAVANKRPVICDTRRQLAKKWQSEGFNLGCG